MTPVSCVALEVDGSIGERLEGKLDLAKFVPVCVCERIGLDLVLELEAEDLAGVYIGRT